MKNILYVTLAFLVACTQAFNTELTIPLTSEEDAKRADALYSDLENYHVHIGRTCKTQENQDSKVLFCDLRSVATRYQDKIVIGIFTTYSSANPIYLMGADFEPAEYEVLVSRTIGIAVSNFPKDQIHVSSTHSKIKI